MNSLYLFTMGGQVIKKGQTYACVVLERPLEVFFEAKSGVVLSFGAPQA